MATNALLELIEGQQKRSKDASDLLVGTTIQTQNKADEVLKGMQDSLGSQVANQQIVLRTQRLAKMEAERKAAGALEIIGGEQNLYEKIVAVEQAGQELTQRVQKLDDLQGVSFFGDGPLDWIKARIEMPAAMRKVETGVMKTQAARTAAMDLNNTIQQTVQTTNATTRTVTDLSINAETDALKAEYDFKAGQVQLDRLRNGLVGVEAIAKAEEGALRRAYDTANFIRGEQQWDLQLKKFKLDQENTAWLREERQMVRADRLARQQFDESTRAKINLARNSRGEPPLEGGEWQSFKEFTPKEELAKLVKLGEQTQQTGIPFVGYSPAETAKAMLSNPNMRFEDARQLSANLILQAMNDLGAIRGSKDLKTQAKYADLLKDKSGQQSEAFINSRVQELITQYTANTDAPTNPFNVGDLGAFLGNGDPKLGVSNMVNLPISEKVLLPAIRAGVKLDSPAVVTKLATDAIKSKQITSSEAISGISALYLRANAMHRQAMGLRAVGITTPEGAQGYRATVGGNIVDMTDPVQVSRILTTRMFGNLETSLMDRLGRMPGVAIPVGASIAGRMLAAPTAETLSNIERSDFQFGGQIATTPENYRIGTDIAREDVRKNVQESLRKQQEKE